MYKNIFIFYNSMKKKYTILSAITILLLTVISSSFFFTTANGQQRLSVLLIHGYLNDASVWDDWVSDLETAGFNVKAVEFNGNDRCGSAADHAKQLINIVEEFKASTGSDKINIVAHSKGGLDARVFLNNSGTHDVANLIMIGTPNAGSPLAFSNDLCSPAVFDIRPGASDLKAGENTNSKYFTIAGDWNPSLKSHCPPIPNFFGFDWPKFESDGFSKLQKPNDGIVPLSSVESLPYSVSLGHPHDCHTNLISNDEYELTKPILKGSIP
jgi:pimeloyl-ACP methyl ester carboxylesterase